MEIEVGAKGKVVSYVEREDTDAEIGSGTLLVYSTACIVALMEGAACEAIQDQLPPDKTTVSTELVLQHTSGTPVGLEVSAEATVTRVDKDVVAFSITVSDEAGIIAQASHKRRIVNSQRYLDRVYEKL